MYNEKNRIHFKDYNFNSFSLLFNKWNKRATNG